MTLVELTYLVELAATRHFGQAAARCQVSQPSLSVAIRKLEAELGGALFERQRGELLVTPLGERVIAKAQQLVQSTHDLRQLAAAGQDQLASPLALGVLPTLGASLLPSLIPHLAQISALRVQAEEAPTAQLRAKLGSGSLDAIVVSLPFAESDILVQPLFDEPLVLLLPAGHPLVLAAELTLSALADQPLVLMAEGHCLRAQVLGLFAAQGLCPQVALTVESLESLRNLVAAGQGLGIVPRSAASPALCERQRLQVKPLAGAQRQLALAWRASFPRHKAIAVLRRGIQVCSGAYWNFTTEPELTEL